MAFTAVLDANVLYPATLRDTLVRLADAGLYRARWTNDILDEMTRSVLRDRTDITPDRIERTRTLMCNAVRDALVSGYEPLIDSVVLPDPGDRHVLAAAIRCSAQVIVTANLADFPPDALSGFNIEAQHPDEFLLNLVDLAPGRVAAIVQQQAAALRKPEQTVLDVLESLTRCGLPRSVAAIRAILG